MNVLVVIPARMKSTRFPGKPLYKIAGREMILRVLDRLPSFEKVVATEDEEIAKVVKGAGYNVFITRRLAECGTDRIKEVAESVAADIYVNVQGDEPLINEADVEKVVKAKIENPGKIIGGMCSIDNNENDVKIIDEGGRFAISRKVYKQVGLYAFNRSDLERFGGSMRESIELTRFNSNDLMFIEVEKSHDVNVISDVEIVERMICRKM